MSASKKTRDLQDVVSEVQAKRGVSKGWPAEFEYEVGPDDTCSLRWSYSNDVASWRRLDSWAVAFLVHCMREAGVQFETLSFEIAGFPESTTPAVRAKLEALKRRLSFLNVTHDDLQFKLHLNGSEIALYGIGELLHRPQSEVVRTDYNERQDDDKGERLEKDLQAFLFGRGFDSKEGRCDRLALLGEDFNKANRFEWGVDREFPTGAFDGRIQESSRLLQTEYVDLVSLNKYKQLSVIELKVNDSGLEVVSQLLDYALFFASYREQLLPIVAKRIGYAGEIAPEVIVCYLANNLHHQRFDETAHFYGANAERLGLKLVKLTFGAPEVLGD